MPSPTAPPTILPGAPAGLFVDQTGAWFHDAQHVRHERLSALLHRSVARDAAGALVVTTGRDVLPFASADCPRFVERIEREPDAVRLHLLGGDAYILRGAFLFCPDARLRVAVGDTYALLLRSAHHVVQSAMEPRGSGYSAVFSPAHPGVAALTADIDVLDAPLDPRARPPAVP